MSGRLRTTDSRPLTPTQHALLYALSTVMTLVRDRLAAGVGSHSKGAAWLRTSAELGDVRRLVEALCEIMCWVGTHCLTNPSPSARSNL